MNEFITALRILTLLPIPGKDTEKLSRCLQFFPIVGLVLGGIVYGFIVGLEKVIEQYPVLIAGIGLLGYTVLTGGLHVDGLADVADGFGSGKDKEKILAIFKDSRLGTFGVIAVFFDLAIKLICWFILISSGKYGVLIASIVAGRCAQALFVQYIRPARNTSMISAFTGSSIFNKIMVLLVVAVCVGLSAVTIGVTTTAFAFGAVSIVSLLFGRYCLFRINGITGDCVGAVSELAEIVVMVVGIGVR
jgi:adenosylcobinamide-GDP ribazoletransferase